MARDISPVETLKYRNELFVGCPVSGTTNYSVTTGINVSAADFNEEFGSCMNGLLLTAGSGNIALTLPNGGEMTIPFTVDAGKSSIELRGCKIKTVKSSGTTFSGYIFPLY